MRVEIQRGGGLAGLVRTVSVDSSTLTAAAAQELEQRVDASGVLGVSPATGAPPGLPDEFSFAVTVDDGTRRRTVFAPESALPTGLRELIAFVEASPAREERVQPPGT